MPPLLIVAQWSYILTSSTIYQIDNCYCALQEPLLVPAWATGLLYSSAQLDSQCSIAPVVCKRGALQWWAKTDLVFEVFGGVKRLL